MNPCTNQITSTGGGGTTLIRGTLSGPGQVSVGLNGSGDKPARMLEGNRFETEVPLQTGSNSLSIAASDFSANRSNYQFTINVAAQSPRNPTYDDDGNLTSDGIRSYEWDILSRLKKITWAPGKTTEFKYNALGQRCDRIDTDSGAVAKRYYLFDGIKMTDSRSGTAPNTATIDRRYFAQGEQRKNGSIWETFIYCRDHLGYTREVVKSDGSTNTLVARYDYDPYGRRLAQYTASSYTGGCDFGYTGHITIQSLESGQTEMVLTHFRAYDPALNRWLSADPIGEEGGMNLYAYVLGDPINGWDPYGLEFWAWNGTAGAWAENVTTFSAGYSDSATFGLTDLARDVLYRNHGGDSVNKCSDSYEWGENAQIGTDVATLGASGGLKLALKAKGKSVARAEANRAIRGLSRTQHHINTVIGHPGGIGSYFPTGGLPASIHSSSWNLRQVTKVEHLSLHRRARNAENAAIGSASLVFGRLDRNAEQGGCD